MPELKIKIPTEAHEKLKKLAKDEYRSLTNYITISLIKLANGELSQAIPGDISIPTSTPTQTPTIEQLKQIGVTSFKLDNAQEILNRKQALQEEKLNRQQAFQEEKAKEKQRAQRIKYLKERMKAILGYIFEYLENDADPKSQPLIDILLKMTNEEYEDWLLERKYEDEQEPEEDKYLYETEITEREQKLKININNNDTYKAIKKYCIDHELTEALYHLIEYPTPIQGNIEYENERYNNFIRSALGSPDNYKYSPSEWKDLIDSLTWIDD